ncbi:hypothetical protein [Brevibacillus porteri]|uniref:hypothetical protein n=1 Tax=Brevibacillus porteri TaxID=2126350 RepID=UPI003D1ABBF1
MAKNQKQEGDQKKPVDSNNTLIYCGPNLPKMGLMHATSYIGGLPKQLELHIEKCPAIQLLCVPTESLANTLSAIRIQGTAQHTWNEEIKSYGKGGGE